MVVPVTGAETVLPLGRVVKIRAPGRDVVEAPGGLPVDAGVSYASSSELLTLDLATRVVLNRAGARVHVWTAARRSHVSRTPTRPNASNLTFNYQRRRPSHWAEFAQAQAEQNKELGFDLRGSVAGGAGRYLLQDRRHDVLAFARPARQPREKPLDGRAPTTSRRHWDSASTGSGTTSPRWTCTRR